MLRILKIESLWSLETTGFVCTRMGGTTAGVKGQTGAGGSRGACFTCLDGGEAREGHQVDEDIRR